MKTALLLVVLIVAAGMAYIRLAPSDPARWHIDPAPPMALPHGAVVAEPGAARAVLDLGTISPEEALSRLDAIALATARTVRLAGSPESGRITWITRSAVFGFPDYTTAAATRTGTSTEVKIYARLRFGSDDFGVNAARLGAWIARLVP